MNEILNSALYLYLCVLHFRKTLLLRDEEFTISCFFDEEENCFRDINNLEIPSNLHFFRFCSNNLIKKKKIQSQ